MRSANVILRQWVILSSTMESSERTKTKAGSMKFPLLLWPKSRFQTLGPSTGECSVPLSRNSSILSENPPSPAVLEPQVQVPSTQPLPSPVNPELSSVPMDPEALLYIQDALTHMIDPPLYKDNFMDVEEVLLELAMYEEIQLKAAKDIPKSSSS